MSLLTPELLHELVAEARLAPSVHNIQPTRWHLAADGRLELVDDTRVRAPVADPTGHDVRVSHGAALEGMSLALNRRGLSVAEVTISERPLSQQHVSVCTLAIGGTRAFSSEVGTGSREENASRQEAGAPFRFNRNGKGSSMPDPLLASVPQRMSWRGTFASSPDDGDALVRIAAAHDDIVGISDRCAITEVAGWADRAELSFLRDDRHRGELLQWMRLSPGDPRYTYDGLNREALAMNAVEAAGARVVLGGLFGAFDRLGLAASLVSDRAKTASAAGIILFCRPRGEDPLITGRHFYRSWLAIDRAGFAACPVSALADHPDFNARLKKLGKIGDDRRLVNVFRVGRRSNPQAPRHFRLPVTQLIV
jgi:nitroreductase